MAKQLGSTAVKRLNRTWRQKATLRVALMVENVESPFDVGAIVRSAAVFSVRHLYLLGSSASPSVREAQKLAMGTDRYLLMSAFVNTNEAVDAAHAEGYRLIGLAERPSSQPLHSLNLLHDICLAVGNSEAGLSQNVIAGCDALGYIPRLGANATYGTAGAVAIAMHEARRQGWQDQPSGKQ